VALAYAVSRILLALQYVYVMCVTQRKARRQHLHVFLINIIICLISAQFWIVAGLLTVNQTAKLVLGYLALGLEVVATLGAGFLKLAIAPASGLLAERFADLTLVILAEGTLGIVKTLADVVSGFGLTAGVGALSAYSECACCLVIVFGMWHFIFHAFNPEDRFGRSHHYAGAWAFLHLPLHFIILLVLSSMKSVAVYQNIGGALTVLIPIFDTALNQTGVTNDYALFDATFPDEDILQFHKLDLQPAFLDEINLLNEQILILSNDSSNEFPDFDPYVQSFQYGAQIFMQVAKTYEVSFSQSTTDAYANLSDVPRDWTSNNTQLVYQENLAEEWWNYFVYVYSVDLMTPSLWIMPCAGGLVILAALITVFRTQGAQEETSAPDEIYGGEEEQPMELRRIKPPRSASFESQWSSTSGTVRLKKMFGTPIYIWEWMPLSIHLLVGIGLCISAVLDNIPSSDDPNVAFAVLDAGWTLPIVALAYGALIVSDLAVLVIIRIAKGGGLLSPLSHHLHSGQSTVILNSPVSQADLPSSILQTVLPALPPTPRLSMPHLSTDPEGPKTPLLSPHAQESGNDAEEATERPPSEHSIDEPSSAPPVRSAMHDSSRLYDPVERGANSYA